MSQTTEREDNVLLVAMELSATTWRLAFGDGSPAGKRSKATLAAGDVAGVLGACARVEQRWKWSGAQVVSCYEAGRDGFWIHRELEQRGVRNLVVDASSIEVDRRQRRAKTDRLDAERLLAQLTRYYGGEAGALREVRIPDAGVEDGRREHRELERLQQEQTGHSNRIKSLGVLHGQTLVAGRKLRAQVEAAHEALPEHLRAEILREYERWQLVHQQINALKKKMRDDLKKRPEDPANKMILALAGFDGIGDRSARVFVHELLLWRDFANAKQVGAAVGLVGTPFASGKLEHEQGISKSGNRRVRAMLIEISWCWLRYQPQSELSQWFRKKFDGTARGRRKGIVALARKLIIALWRFVRDGLIPTGATRQATTAA